MYSQIAANKRKTLLVMFFFVLFVAAIDWLFALQFGQQPTLFIGVLIGSIIYALITYYAGSKMALAVNGAREIQKSDNPRLWNIVENLAITDGLPMPRVFIIDDPAPNAFATGRDPNHSAVCATTGLLEMMTDAELQGVFAHEMGHVKNYDIRVSMIAFALTSVISLIADIILQMTWFRGNDDEDTSPIALIAGIVAAIVAPIVALMIQMAISRNREYLADATGVLTTRYPEGLMSALQKIGQSSSVMRKQSTATAHLFFANPLRGHSIMALFSTHPPIEERIARLQQMGTQA
ncbi:zinc metalloprotease HtpX [Aeromicrobium sp.]|nr:zinc metalloprotease HtpX [Candidatus Saccharibacteria bacterium]